MSIKDLPPDARPREKLLSRGPQALADAELLALLLRTGLPGKPVLGWADELLKSWGGFAGFLKTDVSLLAKTKGLGPAKRAELLAVAEIAKRALIQGMEEKPVMDSPQAVRDYLALQLASQQREVFAALWLDTRQRAIGFDVLFEGTLDQTSVYPREVVIKALQRQAAAVIVAHNHPSGDAKASQADIAITKHLKAALALVDVRLLDHVIVAQGSCTSLQERGLV
jgi:DNA repair protein RadC